MRTALRPKWLGLLGVVVLVVVAFIQLGRWQFGVAQDKALREQLARARAQQSVELSTVLRPHEPFPGALSARRVTASGTYAVDEQVLVPGRRLDGQPGAWVVTAFRTDLGPVLPVLRGFVRDGTSAEPAAAGHLTVTGALAPGESPAHKPAALQPGELGSVDLAVLVNTWPGDLYNAFLFLESEDPPGPRGTIARVPAPTGDAGLNWRNAAYAAQWWVFAGFALWLWWRMVRDDHRRGEVPDGGQDPREGAALAGREPPSEPSSGV